MTANCMERNLVKETTRHGPRKTAYELVDSVKV